MGMIKYSAFLFEEEPRRWYLTMWPKYWNEQIIWLLLANSPENNRLLS